MPKKAINSRALRQLAEDLLRGIAEEFEVTESERRDLVTSLVRQWISYDGNATLFLDGRQVYLVLAKTPLGRFTVAPEPALPGWLHHLTRDWKISPDELPEALEQLNRAQSADVTNDEGASLRLWVNPRERSRGVEEQVKQPVSPGWKRDYRKIAADLLEQQFGPGLAEDETGDLACSLARQWQRYGGHACLFLEGVQLVFTLTELGEGNCRATVERRTARLEPLLDSLGFPPGEIPDVVARINLAQEVEFRDRQGVPSRLWHDPRARQIHVERLAPPAPDVPGTLLPIFCPACGAVLRPWRTGERQQRCPLCDRTVSPP